MHVKLIDQDSKVEVIYVDSHVKLRCTYSRKGLIKTDLIIVLGSQELLEVYGLVSAVASSEQVSGSLFLLSNQKKKVKVGLMKQEVDDEESLYEYRFHVEEVSSGNFVFLRLNPASFKVLEASLFMALERFLI